MAAAAVALLPAVILGAWYCHRHLACQVPVQTTRPLNATAAYHEWSIASIANNKSRNDSTSRTASRDIRE
jgi:hypothetical protein